MQIETNALGHLTLGSCDALSLAAEYGTPLYVLDETQMRESCRAYRTAMAPHGVAAYAGKAFLCRAMARLIAEEGLWLDVCSGGELHIAIAAGFPAEHILFHGNNKTAPELSHALELGCGRFVVDNTEELTLLDALARSAGVRAKVQLRIRPGVEADTHHALSTARHDAKFGFSLSDRQALAACRQAGAAAGIELVGLHCHVGSQLFSTAPYAGAIEKLTDLLATLAREDSLTLPELNIGGGLGIPYRRGDPQTSPAPFIAELCADVARECTARGLKTPFLFCEPGRSIVGSAGTTLYTVGSVKRSEACPVIVSIDGGMADNPRYCLYEARYEILRAASPLSPRSETITLAGRCCESGDLIGEELPTQPLSAGDIVAVLATGAYNYSMASRYNCLPRPPVVFVKEGQARLVVRRETYDDLLAADLPQLF